MSPQKFSGINLIRKMSELMPLIFLSHGGGPCFFMNGLHSPMFKEADENSNAARFLKSVGDQVGSRPKAILVVSAHWEESNFTVGYQPRGTSLIYDYYGFPEETYAPHLTYECATDLNLADRVASLLEAKGHVCEKSNRGFDHGVFIPLKLAYPSGDIPVVQLSLRSNLDISTHISMGEALAPLRSEGVLIIGSGQNTHNLGEFARPNSAPVSWAAEFNEWVRSTLEGCTIGNVGATRQALVDMKKLAPHFSRAHPRIEHLIPLHVVFGAAFPQTCSTDPNTNIPQVNSIKRIYHQIMLGTMSLDSYLFK
eukprot:gene11158-23319_t